MEPHQFQEYCAQVGLERPAYLVFVTYFGCHVHLCTRRAEFELLRSVMRASCWAFPGVYTRGRVASSAA